MNRALDLFIGLTVGILIPPTLSVFGIPWVVIGLGITILLKVLRPLFKKLGRFLLDKLIKVIKDELKK